MDLDQHHLPEEHLPSNAPRAPMQALPSNYPSSSSAPQSSASSSSARTASQATSLSSVDADTSSLCSHLSTALSVKDDLQAHLQLGVRWALSLKDSTALREQENGKKRRKTHPPACCKCSLTLSRPLLCLDCAVVHCGSAEGGDHAKEHASKTGHQLVCDLRSCAVFCYACTDYVYHPTLEHLLSLETIAFEESRSNPKHTNKRKRLAYQGSQSYSPRPADSILPRGLRNLGNTCYMSVILQSFLHNPLLRAFFLSDRHNRDLCTLSTPTKPCISCEMDRLYSECFAADSAPFGPTNFMYSMWQSSSELAGYAQQDAHEFLISSLNLLHSSTPNHKNVDCPCIVHTTFAGQLRSEVKCGKCSNVTTSADPFLDLSLDLRPGKNVTTGLAKENTLAGCLARFTAREELLPNQYTCAKCGDSTHIASKQLSIRKLPPVLCIQLKRFEHSVGSHKIDTKVRFPLKLNMRQYTSSFSSASSSKQNDFDTPDSMFEYELFSVINHEGQTISNGHYTNFCRYQDDFYCFDDEKVRRVPLATVLGSQSYLLSYVKKTLAYSVV